MVGSNFPSLAYRESLHQAIIPGLPDDLALRCLAKLSHGYYGLLETVSKTWRDLIRSSDYANYKSRERWCGNWLFVLTEVSKNEWVGYDPEADRWHPLPKIPTVHAEWKHYGFSSISVCNRFFVIGGSYAWDSPAFPHQRPLVTNEVMQFDPFKKQWTNAASMLTPRSHFACSVVSGKIYVAGGRNLSCTRGLALAEVYDPVADKYAPIVAPSTDIIINCLFHFKSFSFFCACYMFFLNILLRGKLHFPQGLAPCVSDFAGLSQVWPDLADSR